LAPGGLNSYSYFLFRFTVGTNGVAYRISVTSASPTTFDSIMMLYQGAFSSANPTSNFLFGNDDASGVTLSSDVFSSLNTTLYSGFTYSVVVSTYSSGYPLASSITLECSSTAGDACTFLD